MKKIFLFITTMILFSQNLKSQITIVDPYIEYDLALGYDMQAKDLRYYKDFNGNLNPFIGVWKNTTGNKTFKITLYKKEMDYMGGYYMDSVEGNYQMIENEGQANESVLFKSNISINNGNDYAVGIHIWGNYPALSGVAIDNTYYTASFPYINPLRLDFRLDPANNNKAYWKLKDRREFKIEGYNGTPLPMDIILTKQ
jgi:hypothetical protein